MSLIDFTAEDFKEELCGNWKLGYFKICFHFNSEQHIVFRNFLQKIISIKIISVVALLKEGRKIALNFDIFLLFYSVVDRVFFK